jgi:ankyrin repeat protein
MASAYGYEDCIKLFLSNGANVDHISDTHGTALQAAVSRGNYACTRLLLEAGADPNLRGAYTADTVAMALEYGYTRIWEDLKQYGAKEDPVPQKCIRNDGKLPTLNQHRLDQRIFGSFGVRNRDNRRKKLEEWSAIDEDWHRRRRARTGQTEATGLRHVEIQRLYVPYLSYN